jgi:hypothetical protein
MEVGARRGAHFQLSRRGDRPIPITWRNSMKPRLILLFTFDQLVRESVLARRNLDQGEISKKGGRQPESVELLPI